MTDSCWVTPHLVAGVPGYRQRDLALLVGNDVLSEKTKGEQLEEFVSEVFFLFLQYFYP